MNDDRDGTTSEPEPAGAGGPDADLRDLVAAYAIDAVEPDDELLVESYLAGSAPAATGESALRDAGIAYALAVLPDLGVPSGLRDRVLSSALQRRPGVGPSPSTAVELHRFETERALMLFGRIRGEQWSAPVDPSELAGWTVRDLVTHLLANESLLALELGITDPCAPETERTNVARTDATRARLDHHEVAELVDDYRTFVRAVDERVTEMTNDELEAELSWWGAPMRVSTALVVRTFETWTHADDIRRAIGLPHVPPSAPDLRAMSERTIDWIPLMMASTGPVEPSVATIVLTGPGGGTHTAQLGLEPAPAGAAPRFALTVDVVDYCRAIARRVPPTGLAHTATGDTELADALTGALGTLADI